MIEKTSNLCFEKIIDWKCDGEVDIVKWVKPWLLKIRKMLGGRGHGDCEEYFWFCLPKHNPITWPEKGIYLLFTQSRTKSSKNYTELLTVVCLGEQDEENGRKREAIHFLSSTIWFL